MIRQYYTNFMNIPPEHATLKNSKVVIVPFGYEATTTYKTGTKDGPDAIISASKQVELYDCELECEPYEAGIATIAQLEMDRKDYYKPIKQLKSQTAKLIKMGKFPIILGGEHSLSFGPIAAFAQAYPDLVVLHIDAHADLRDEFEGTIYSHAAVMRRVIDVAPLVQLFIRNISKDEAEFVKTTDRTKIFYDHDYRAKKWGVSDVIKALGNRPVYLSIDVDGFSPEVIPATGTPEPGGASWHDVLDILREVFKTKNVVGADIVELAPMAGSIYSDFTIAKLAYKLVGYKYFLK